MKDLKKVLTYIFAALLVLAVIGLAVSLIRNAVAKDDEIDNNDGVAVIEQTFIEVDHFEYDYQTGEMVVIFSNGASQRLDMSDIVNNVVDEILIKTEECEHKGTLDIVYTVQEPSCIQDGIYICECGLCGEVYFYTIEASAYYHSGSVGWDWSEDYSGATVTFTCHTCGESVTLEATVTSETVEPTCDADGYILYTAVATYSEIGRKLANTKTVTLAATGHSWDDGEVTTEATCTETGVMTYTCTVCGETKTEEIEATGHSWDDGEVTTEATCDTDGKMTYTCTVCGETKVETIEATGHSWDDGEEDGDGNTVYTCTVCGETKTEAADEVTEVAAITVIDSGTAAVTASSESEENVGTGGAGGTGSEEGTCGEDDYLDD